MSIFFAHQFDIDPPTGQTSRQCLAELREHVVVWIRDCYYRDGDRLKLPADTGTVMPRKGHVVQIDQQECATHRLATVSWELCDALGSKPVRRRPTVRRRIGVKPSREIEAHPAFTWYFTATLACNTQSVQAALVVGTRSAQPILREFPRALSKTNPLESLGGLVVDLLDGWQCRMGGQPIPTKPAVYGADEMEAFVETVLFNPQRILPILLVGPEYRPAGGLVRPIVAQVAQFDRTEEIPIVGWPATGVPLHLRDRGSSLAQVQDRLLGLAQVAALGDRRAAERLTVLAGANAACAGDQIRLFCPGLQPGQLFDGATLYERRSDTDMRVPEIYAQLARLSGQLFEDGVLIRAARAALARAAALEHQARIDVATQLADVETELRQTRQARENFRRERDATQQQLQAQQQELAEIRQRLAAFSTPAVNGTPDRDGQLAELAAELERSWDENRRAPGGRRRPRPRRRTGGRARQRPGKPGAAAETRAGKPAAAGAHCRS